VRILDRALSQRRSASYFPANLRRALSRLFLVGRGFRTQNREGEWQLVIRRIAEPIGLLAVNRELHPDTSKMNYLSHRSPK
jgi:hypothetical protein